MADSSDILKAEMINRIHSGGAWFSTRPNNFLKIGSSDTDGRLYARECVIRDGGIYGNAYAFGADWFDISFHGRLIDIFIDMESLTKWDILHDNDGALYLRGEDWHTEYSGGLAEFCRQAEKEITAAAECCDPDDPEKTSSGSPSLSDSLKAFLIDGAGFAQELQPSEKKMGRSKDILSIVDLTGLGK